MNYILSMNIVIVLLSVCICPSESSYHYVQAP